MKIIGVTGSHGKTTTTWMLRSILRAAGYRVGLFGTVEYDLCGEIAWAHHTTPNRKILTSHFATLKSRGADFCVMELASESYVDGRLSFLRPDSLVLTSVLPGFHLAEHGTEAAYRAAKGRAIASAGPAGLIFANIDDAGAQKVAFRYAPPRPVIWYGANPAAYLRCGVIHADRYGTVLQLETPNDKAIIQTRLIGAHQAHNAAAAAAVAMSYGARMRYVVEGIECMAPIPARLEPVGDFDGIRVYVDYGHPEAAMDHTLRALRGVMGDDGRILAVFGASGGRPSERRREYGRILDAHAHAVYLTADCPRDDDPRDTAEQVRDGMGNPAKCEIITDRQDAIRRAVDDARPGDSVIVLGRGLELVQELAAGYASVESDHALARDAVRRRTKWGSVA